jgi:hypothetical protein
MFFAIEIQTSGVYVLFDPQSLFTPPELVIRNRKIALHGEYIVFWIAKAPPHRKIGLPHGQRVLVMAYIG